MVVEQGGGGRGAGWKKIEVSSGHFIWARPVDPGIQAQMPETKKNFMQIGPVELLVHEIKRVLHPDQEIPL